MARAGVTPVFVDVTPNTYQLDTVSLEAAVTDRTTAILVPNLIGNCPDWDVIRDVADRHDLVVIEDSCDCMGATLRGTPTGARSDMSLTSFALSHIITAAGTGGMICLNDDEWIDRALKLRRWGRRSEVALWGSKRGAPVEEGERRFFSQLPDGQTYDDLFIFDELGWNFEPSELSAAFGVVQMDRLDGFLERRKRNVVADRVLRSTPRALRDAAAHPRRRYGLAHVSHPDPTGVTNRSGRLSAAHGAGRRRHPHGVDRQRHPPTGLR